MKLGWGWKIAVLYGGFVALILVLVIASNYQKIDLVSSKYYDAELAYQKVIDADKNQTALSMPVNIHANESAVSIEFPEMFKDKAITGDIEFYAPVNSEWDRNFQINTQNNIATILRSSLRNTRYTVKVSYKVDGKDYYQESEIFLHS
ncbi:MAG: FixH family protein [Bacteroidota bacterium]